MSDLKTLLSKFDDQTGLLCEHDISSSIKELEERTEQSRAEFIAFEFTENFRHPNYFGPFMSGITSDGRKIGVPDISYVTPEMLDYWSQRTNDCKHPVLKARYSGLVWEFSREITKRSADVSMARLRIDSVTNIATRGYHKYRHAVITMLDHALRLSIRINDTARTEFLCETIVAYEDRIAEDRKGGLWGFSYDILWKKKNTGLTEEQRTKIIHDLEQRLERLSNPSDNSPPDPWAAERAAIRLAEHYRAANASEDVRRVLLKYGSAFEPLCQSASPLLVSGWLKQVHEIYNRFGLKEESQLLRQRLRALGPDMIREFSPIAVPLSIEREQLDTVIEQLLEGDHEAVAMRIALEFLPLRQDMEQQVRQLAKDAPFLASITHELTDNQGRTIAQIGSVDKDVDARILLQISQAMKFMAPFLRLTLRRWSERFGWGSEALVDYLRRSPLFEEDRLPIIREGAKAYFQENSLIATHLWIPQVEQAIRLLVGLRGGDVLKPNRAGGLNLKPLDELLRDSKVLEVLGEDVALYFRALFTDPRGWNLRNDICHGLLPAEQVQLEATDRILHALLILGNLREATNKLEVDNVEVQGAAKDKK